ncbi:MAG: sulfatase-like hydrolase/transferase [Thermoleophilia bacterium]
MLDRLMPSWARLRAHGVEFTSAYCAASQCSPSRACLLTGEYAPTQTALPTLPGKGWPPTLADTAQHRLGHRGLPATTSPGRASGTSASAEPAAEHAAEQGGVADGGHRCPRRAVRHGSVEPNAGPAGNNAGAFGTAKGVPSMVAERPTATDASCVARPAGERRASRGRERARPSWPPWQRGTPASDVRSPSSCPS